MNSIINGFIYFMLLGLSLLFNSCNQPNSQDYTAFDTMMVKALDLKLVLRNQDYGNSQIRIFNDTIVAFTVSKEFNNKTKLVDEYHIYSVQSINKPQNKIEFNNPELRFPSISPIDQFRNGCLYFGKFGGSTVQSLCTNGKLTEYFKQNDDTLFYANKVLLYKDLAVVNSMNGIFLFNIKTQKLLWENRKHLGFLRVFFTIAGNKLLMHTGQDVTCMNLDNLNIMWSRNFKNITACVLNRYNDFTPRYHILTDSKSVFIPTLSTCYVLDIKTGDTKYSTSWIASISYKGQFQYTYVENTKLYASYADNKNTLLCIDMVTNKKLWAITHLEFIGIHNNHLVAITPDQKFYVVINKTTGKLEYKIANPNVHTKNFSFIDGYVLINSLSLYK